jgi:2-polyprenyl-6-hydroxyphenyl methylase / 3-demethylubiquinone-9 3-methyltransferase
MAAQKITVDEAEIFHFSQDSAHWWEEDGPFRPLHRLNPIRMHYIKDQICQQYNRDFNDLRALDGLSVLDIGCGGGLACEPMARMGAHVTGIDADVSAVNTAKTHAESAGLAITYICGDIQSEDRKFDVILALEVIEHVNNPEAFFNLCAARLRPGGILILSTLNRTMKSYALGIIAAEHILRWVPRGTHSWKKFIKPSEISAFARQNGLIIHDIKGVIYRPTTGDFALSATDIDVNYLITLRSRH